MIKKVLVPILWIFLMVSCNPLEKLESGKLNKMKETAIVVKQPIGHSFFPRNLHLTAIGDSLTQGVGDSKNSGGYLPYFANLLEKDGYIHKVEFENFGVRGNTSEQLLKRLHIQEIKDSLKESDLIILTIGGNDLMKVIKSHFNDLKLEQFRSGQLSFKNNLISILQMIRVENQKAPIIIVGLYNPFFQWFTDVKEMNEIVDEWNRQSLEIVGKRQNVYFVDIHEIFLNNEENLLYTDYFHPNDRGYELIAERISQVLDQKGLEKIFP